MDLPGVLRASCMWISRSLARPGKISSIIPSNKFPKPLEVFLLPQCAAAHRETTKSSGAFPLPDPLRQGFLINQPQTGYDQANWRRGGGKSAACWVQGTQKTWRNGSSPHPARPHEAGSVGSQGKDRGCDEEENLGLGAVAHSCNPRNLGG